MSLLKKEKKTDFPMGMSKADYMYFQMSKSEMNHYLKSHVRDKTKERFDVLDQTVRHGLDVNSNVYMEGVPWLFYACKVNDIVFLGKLIKHGANIHKTTKNSMNVLHYCVEENKPELLNFFIKRGVNINLVSDSGVTPVESACDNEDIECAKILFNQENVKIQHDKEQFSLFDSIVYGGILQDKPRHTELLELFLKKKHKFDKKDFEGVIHLFHDEHFEAVKFMLKKFPHLVNKKIKEGDTLAFLAFTDGHYHMADFMVQLHNFDYTKINKNGLGYIHVIASKGLKNIMKTILKVCPQIATTKCVEGMTAIDHLLKSINITDDTDLIEMIKMLASAGCDVNCNKANTLELAIRYRSWNVVSNIIDLGAIFNYDVKLTQEYPVSVHDDILGFAIQIGNYKTVDMLINRDDTILHKVYKRGNIVYTTVLLAIMFQRAEILTNILFKVPEIREFITPNMKTFLLDYAISSGVTDTQTLEVLSNDIEIVKVMELDNIGLLMNHVEKCIGRHWKSYTTYEVNEKQEFLRLLLILFNIFSEAIDVTYDTILKPLKGAVRLYDILLASDVIDISSVDVFVDIVADMTDFYNINALHQCLALVYSIETCHLCEFHTTELIKKINVAVQWFDERKEDFDMNFFVICKLMQKYDSEEQQIQKVSRNVIVKQSVKLLVKPTVLKELFKLYWPTKVNHYDFMFNSLTNNTDTVIDENGKIVIMAKNNIKSTVLKIKGSTGNLPTRWINTYSPNIGCDEKDDYNHNFSFLLDSKLKNWPCVEEQVEDPTHEGGINSMMYFYGMLQYEGVLETGCYEYFINSYGTLFHRMFRPYRSLPKDVKKMLNL